VLVQAPHQEELVAAISAEWTRFYGPDPLTSDDLGCIVNDAQFQRLETLLSA
jgi:aldehyde dehydrogenase (NAD+)